MFNNYLFVGLCMTTTIHFSSHLPDSVIFITIIIIVVFTIIFTFFCVHIFTLTVIESFRISRVYGEKNF